MHGGERPEPTLQGVGGRCMGGRGWSKHCRGGLVRGGEGLQHFRRLFLQVDGMKGKFQGLLRRGSVG